MFRVGLALLISIMSGCTLGYQASFSLTSTNFATSGATSLSAASAQTKKNTPVNFSAGQVNGRVVGKLSFDTAGATSTITTANGGVFTITDANNYKVLYKPAESFVGVDNATVYALDIYGNHVPGSLSVLVGNILNVIQPALAIRGMSCITCHSSISSNIIADYGYGNSWFFDTSVGDSPYFDRIDPDDGLATISLLNNSQIIVPKAPIASGVLPANSFSGVTSLAQFAQARFTQTGCANGEAPNYSVPNPCPSSSPNPLNSQPSQVREVQSLAIQIPTAARIAQIFNNPTTNQVYLPDTQKSPPLQGLSFDSTNNLFAISSLTCDGDLYLGGTVLFENATVSSINGCRIYATGSVFIDGPLTASGYQGSSNSNIQILSATSIWAGVGKIYQNSFCEVDASGDPTGWYNGSPGGVNCTQSANAADPTCDTFYLRAAAMIVKGFFSASAPTTSALTAALNVPAAVKGVGYNGSSSPAGAIVTERLHVESHLGRSLYDASCTPGSPNGRNVSMSRLMLVAPYVNYRYSGDVSGSVISEAAIMSLGTFTYQFDPVFSKVSIFSLLNSDELISGQF